VSKFLTPLQQRPASYAIKEKRKNLGREQKILRYKKYV